MLKISLFFVIEIKKTKNKFNLSSRLFASFFRFIYLKIFVYRGVISIFLWFIAKAFATSVQGVLRTR